MNKALLIFMFSVLFTLRLASMDDASPTDIESQRLESQRLGSHSPVSFSNGEGIIYLQGYYDEATKTLNLRNLGLTDDSLHSRYKAIKRFVNLVHAENLILEHNNLVTIPYYLITFALINKYLRYLSLKHNKFNIPLMIVREDMQPDIVIPLEAMHDLEFRTISCEVEEALRRNRSGSIGKDNMVGMVAHNLWESISPHIEVAIAKHNSKKRDRFLYKKIIIIDNNIPPITIIDYQDVPKSRCEIIKEFCYRISFLLIGASVTLIPQIVTWVISSTDDAGEQSGSI